MRVFWRTAAMMAILAAGIFSPWPALAWTSKKETMTPEEYKAWHAATAKRAICKTNCMRHLYAVDGDSGAHDVYWCAKNWERLVPRCYRAADSDDAGGGGGGGGGGGPTPPVVINGVCGADHGGAFASPLQPTNLCAAGILSGGLVGIGPWSWTCDGENGGSSASCSANKPNSNIACSLGPYVLPISESVVYTGITVSATFDQGGHHQICYDNFQKHGDIFLWGETGPQPCGDLALEIASNGITGGYHILKVTANDSGLDATLKMTLSESTVQEFHCSIPW